MPIIKDSKYVPDYDSCKTVQALEQEYSTWAYDVAMGKFCTDKGIVYQKGVTDNLYLREASNAVIAKNKFYIVTSSTGNYYYYFGGDKDVKKKLQSNYHSMETAKQKMRINSSLSDISNVVNKELYQDTYSNEQKAKLQGLQNAVANKTATQADIDKINKELGTKFTMNSTAAEIEKESKSKDNRWIKQGQQELSNLKSYMEGSYIQSEASRKSLQSIIDIQNDTSLTDEDRKKKVNDAIWVWNQTYGKSQNIEIQGTASVKELQNVANKKNGVLSITGNDVAKSIKQFNKDVFEDSSSIWDNSNNKTIKTLRDKGITGDMAWGVITGKYNKDEACAEDLKALQKKIKEGKLTEEQKKKEVDKLNEKYNLKLGSDVTADDIAKIVDSNDKATYNKKVKDIARKLIEQKINEQLNATLESRLGGTLKSLGINFSFKDRDTLKDIVDIIRGQKNVQFNEKKFLKGLQDVLEKKINKLIQDKVNPKVDEYAKKVNAQIDSTAKQITTQLDAYRKGVENIGNKLTMFEGEQGKLLIANKLDSLISSPVNSIANILNAPDKLLGKIGVNLGLGTMFKEITQVYTKGYAERIQKVFKPAIDKALGIIKKVSASIKKVIDAVNKLRDRAKQMVEKWKNAVKDAIKAQTKKLINEITKYVKLNITSAIGGSFKI